MFFLQLSTLSRFSQRLRRRHKKQIVRHNAKTPLAILLSSKIEQQIEKQDRKLTIFT